MRNIKLVIEYDGSRYDGWQKQPKNPKSITIQDKIEQVLSKMEQENIELIGAARTEAGVHAYGQIANFITSSKMKLYEIKHYLNRYLPRDIAVLETAQVPERFHSSFNAKSFEYEYKIALGEVASVFDRKYSYYSFKDLDLAAMKKAASCLIGTHDFKAFSDNKRMKKSTIRKIQEVDVYRDLHNMTIHIHGDDFWPHFARIIAGTLMEVGYHNMDLEQVKLALDSGIREHAGPAAESHGLFLSNIHFE